MSDEKEKELTHGFEIHAGTHHEALQYLKDKKSEAELKDMVHFAKNSGHGFDFQFNKSNGEHRDYKLAYEGGKLVIHRAHNS